MNQEHGVTDSVFINWKYWLGISVGFQNVLLIACFQSVSLNKYRLLTIPTKGTLILQLRSSVFISAPYVQATSITRIRQVVDPYRVPIRICNGTNISRTASEHRNERLAVNYTPVFSMSLINVTPKC